MSGIAGILNLDGGPVDPAQLERMARALAHRGPDGWRCWNEGPVGLVHLLLAIDPEPPLPLVREGRALTLDGRIDNLRTLTRLIRRKERREGLGGSLSGDGNAPEVVLASYRFWGISTPRALLGDFAFALWDHENRRLLLVRDPVGSKPLFYFQDARRLIFASEIKAILAVSGIPCEADEVRLREFDHFRFRSLERTFFAGIRRLPPGEALIVERDAVRREVFWQPDPEHRIRMRSRNAYRTRFRKLFFEAVRCRLPYKGQVAIRLSGGLDSSSIAGACAYIKKTERPDLFFTSISILSDLIPDERRYIEMVCRENGFENTSFIAEKQNLLDEIDRSIYHQESPVFEALDPWILHQHKIAKEKEARVVLGGDWGDQVMGSSAYLVDLLREARWREFWREFWLFLKWEGGTYKDLIKMIFWYLVLPARISDKFEGLRYILRRVALPWRPISPGGPRFPLAAQREHYDGVFGIHNVQLLEMLDKMAAQWGVEARLPFLDRRLVEFTMAIPWEENIREGWGRRLEREALDGVLPRSIAQRKDKGDYTDLEYICLVRAGFKARGPSRAVDLWRQKIKELWEEVWIKKKGTEKRNTSARALLTTAT